MTQFNSKFLNPQITRRRALALALAGTAGVAVSGMTIGAAAAQSPSKKLQQPVGIQLLETRLKLELEVDGIAKLTDDKEAKAKTAPVKSKATQDYLETIAYRENQPVGAARQYIIAKSDNWVAGKVISHSLRSEVSNTRVVLKDGTWEQYSDEQPLQRREVELLRSPINTLALEKLLSAEPARTDSQWAISADDAKDLFNLDAVHNCTLTAKIVGVEKSTAKVEIEGTLQATANAVPTEIEVRGNAHVIMGSQCAMVSWVGMSIKESREISENQPGFTVTARLQLVRQELKGKLETTYDELLKIAEQTDSGKWLVRLDSRANFTTLTGRNWVTYLDSIEDVVLRCVEKNKIIAQCNVAPLPKMEAGTQLTLEGMQQDMRDTLGKSFGEFLESSERLSGSKLRLLRCEAAGMQEDVAIRWVYAHLSDDSGRRLLIVFTYAAEFAENFTGNDLQILDTLEFTTPTTLPTETANSKPKVVK